MTGASDREDRQMARDVVTEKAYKKTERQVFLSMRPDEISESLWRVIWKSYMARDNRVDAMADAKFMAIELNESTEVITVKCDDSVSYYYAKPINDFRCYVIDPIVQIGYKSLFEFKLKLFKEGRYPDIGKQCPNFHASCHHDEHLRFLQQVLDKKRPHPFKSKEKRRSKVK